MSVSLVLASGSSRRRDILTLLGLEFVIRAPDIDEAAIAGETADETALRLSIEKVRTASRGADELVVAADTLVLSDGVVLGKPADSDEARQMIAALSGRSHEVHTGLAVLRGGRIASGVARTVVRFRPLSDDDIAAYVDTGEPLDKAGAYGIQGYGAALVERIDGDFYNVMGLPVPLFLELVTRLGLRFLFGLPATIVDPTQFRAAEAP